MDTITIIFLLLVTAIPLAYIAGYQQKQDFFNKSIRLLVKQIEANQTCPCGLAWQHTGKHCPKMAIPQKTDKKLKNQIKKTK